MNILLNWLISALVILAIAYILPGVSIGGFFIALVVALVLGLINAFIRPIVLLLTLPINIITLGLFTLVVNTLMVMLADFVVSGFDVDNFWWALLFAVALWLVNGIIKNDSMEKNISKKFKRT